MSATPLRALLMRVEAATGPDREIDLAMAMPLNRPWSYGGEPPRVISYARVTASLDAAVALVERVLPGWSFLWAWNGERSIANVHIAPIGRVHRRAAGEVVSLFKVPGMVLVGPTLSALCRMCNTEGDS